MRHCLGISLFLLVDLRIFPAINSLYIGVFEIQIIDIIGSFLELNQHNKSIVRGIGNPLKCHFLSRFFIIFANADSY